MSKHMARLRRLVSLFVILSVVSLFSAGVFPASAQQSGFLTEFHSGRSLSVSGPYLYARTMNFAQISSSGNVIPAGTRISDTHGAADWNTIDRLLRSAAQKDRILILGLWVCNFETVTESGIRAFLTQLSNKAANLNTHVIWLPAWEFNQHQDWHYTSKWNWGLGCAGSPRYWYIAPNVYNNKMQMIRNARDSLGINNVLICSQPDSLFRYTYPNWYGEHDPAPLTGQRVVKNYRAGIAQADIIGCSMYVGEDRVDSGLYDIRIIQAAFDWMHKMHDYIDPTKPFFAMEYNSLYGIYSDWNSRANTFFIENTYKQVPTNFNWGLRAIVWWSPFANSQAWQTCSYWAGEYDGYASSTPTQEPTTTYFTLSPNPATPGMTVTLSGTLTGEHNDPVYPAQVGVEYSDDGGATWHNAWTLNTDTAGRFSETFTAPDFGEYILTATYSGSTSHSPSSHTETLTVRTSTASESWIFFNLAPNPATPSSSVTLKGVLVDDSSSPISGANVRVDYSTNDGATWIYSWTLTTDQDGIFSRTFSAPEQDEYLVEVSYAGDSIHAPSNNYAYLIVRSSTVQGGGSIYFNLNPNPATSGTTVSLEGILLDQFNNPVSYATVTVEYSTNHGGTWSSIWALDTNQHGIFSQTFTAPGSDTYLVRANYGASRAATYFLVP